MKEYILLMVSAALVNNVILARFLGLCSFMGVTTRIDTAIGMGMATTFVITVSSMADWAVQNLSAGTLCLGLSAHRDFHSGHCRRRAVHRNDGEKSFAAAVPDAGHLPAADHHQLRRAGRGPAAGRGQNEFYLQHPVRLRFVHRLQPGDGDVCRPARTSGAGDVPRLFAGPPIGFIVASLLALAFMGFSGMSAS